MKPNPIKSKQTKLVRFSTQEVVVKELPTRLGELVLGTKLKLKLATMAAPSDRKS